MQYPVRGIADKHLLKQALRQIPDGQRYSLVSLEYFYPSPCVFLGSGSSHTELQHDFSEILGQSIGVGQDPFDAYDDVWFRSHIDEVFILSVNRNQNYYKAFDHHPDNYQELINLWQK